MILGPMGEARRRSLIRFMDSRDLTRLEFDRDRTEMRAPWRMYFALSRLEAMPVRRARRVYVRMPDDDWHPRFQRKPLTLRSPWCEEGKRHEMCHRTTCVCLCHLIKRLS
jgi:hypothetical protein